MLARLAAAAALFGAILAAPAQAEGYGAQLEGFDYPHEVRRFAFTSQTKPVEMAYMDVAPTGAANGRVALLLHGKNFCAATFESAIAALAKAGFRVIAPDQIGFCKSSKPDGYQYSFHQLAANTRALLASLGVERSVVLGHSMGGMVATRYALDFPAATERLVLVNPIGLEDWKAKGVPYATIDKLLEGERKTSPEAIKAYQLKFYYSGEWKPAYDRWVDMSFGMYAGPGKEAVMRASALTSDMIFTQPVVYELPKLKVPTTLFIGLTDRTAPGANRAAPEIAKTLGDYPALGKAAASAIPGAELVEFPELGHSPHVQAPAEFEAALLKALGR
ncbi:alpha/beta fold hydrolase [Methylopila henanensis]|uniref:Alpha/beta fold hydrolase n=1 Tax=Methylopila henanensis TaxID=873516 RepID=A0ABW4KF60_9HYPH